MPTRALTMRKIRDLIRLKFISHLSHEQIARSLSISKGVVAKYSTRIQQCGVEPQELLKLADAQILERVQPRRYGEREGYGGRVPVDCARVHTELKRAGVTLTLLWQEYVAAHPGQPVYRHSQFAVRYQNYVATLRRSMRQVHRAGEKLFIDYAGQTVPYGDDGQRAQVFVAVLGASNYTFACATSHQRLEDWVDALGRALTFIGGVPRLIVPDNARALIASPDRYEPRASLSVQDLANHYGTAILPARPYRPQDKAKVEVGVQLVQRWILARLRDQTFRTLAEVDEAIGNLLDPLNARPFKRLEGCRRSAYETLDRPALQPLPASPYELARYYKARVNIDYHLAIQEHFYSVPHSLVHQELEARVTSTSVEILHRGQRVAAHQRSLQRFGHSTVADHMPAAHRAHMEWSPARLIRWGAQHGPACAQVIERILTTRKHPEQGYRACLGLLRLEKQHGAQRLEAACVRALALGSPAYQTVASILSRRIENLPVEEGQAWSAPEHAHLRGPKYYQ